MERYDCYAYENENRCNALKEKWCNGCKFYKSKKQYDLDMDRTIQFCQEAGIDKYNDYFKYYKRMKRIKEMKGVEAIESINDI